MPEPVVLIEALSYRYPGARDESLRELDLAVREGEFVVVAGRSGSGKTTLLRACCGLVPHYHGGTIAGSIEIAGLDARDHGPAELGGEVGMVAQDPETQVISTTVRGELELPLEMLGEGPAARARAVEEVSLALAIPHLLDRPTDVLSGGELQRVALAAALVARPRLVLLDEPTSQLDPVAGDELIWLLRRLNEQWGTAVVLAEHRLERCLAAADRAVALREGVLAFDGGREAFLEWALREEPALATPAARLFDLAGVRPLPAGVKSAREALAREGLLAPVPLSHPVGSTAQGASIAERRAHRSRADKLDARGRREGPEARRLRRTSLGWRRARRSEDGAAALEARDLWVELDAGEGPRAALRGLDLAIERGERVALMGRNGAGKSTLLRCAAGLVEPVRGQVRAPGGCALLAQSPVDLLVRERVADELPGDAGLRALEDAGLAWAQDRDPRDLSGGERQRLALAIVMAGRSEAGSLPGLICLDEPTRGMDRARKQELAGTIVELAGAGSAVLVATHDVELAAAFAERVVLLGEATVIADGPPEEILAGGWYFATEVARILGQGGAIAPERGAELLRARRVTEETPAAIRELAP